VNHLKNKQNTINIKSDDRLKRIEYRGKYLRASRTGGVALRAQGKAAGINFTVNSNKGIRVSKRIAKGTNIGFQKGRFVLRGRFGKGPTKLNLSKSGFSVSSKTSVGTINWFKPKSSSAKIGGIQFRGDNALMIQFVFALFQIFYNLIKVAFKMALWIIKTTFWLFKALLKVIILVLKKLKQHRLRRTQKALEALEVNWYKVLQNQPSENLFSALFYTLIIIGSGKSKAQSDFINQKLKGFEDKNTLEPILSKISNESFESAIDLTFSSLDGHSIEQSLLIESFFGCLVEAISMKIKPNELIAVFWALDFCVHTDGKRNRFQEELFGVFSDICGFEPISE
tara:strand:+ start:1561 stop:2580 length:1020 start_codon:yes stop_codon:yes gene_type:complete